MFEVVFDYGEGHYVQNPDPLPLDKHLFIQANLNPTNDWPVRPDPFSSYRAGFEVRTYRLCQRVLMFHHFPMELGAPDYLVRSTEFDYDKSLIASFMTRVTKSGYLRQDDGSYLKKSLPPLEFTYSQLPTGEEMAQQPVEAVDPISLENLPAGLDGAAYQWIDLDGEGTSGILTEQGDGWFYKRNLSANHQVQEDSQERTTANFGPVEVVASKPAGGLSGAAQFLDLAGDGQVDLVHMEGQIRGYYERTDEAGWEPFVPFTAWPNLDPRDPNLRFLDLTGDGHADILVSEDSVFLWCESLGEDGFGPAERVQQAFDEEKGPHLVFNDGTQSFYLADLSGDGLTDLARIRNGEVCYWPNLGYGRFGAKVTMDSSPWFDVTDQFEQRRIRLVDTDGSGTTDILYLGRDGVQVYFNQSGNRWSDGVTLPQFPAIDNLSAVQVLDLLGNGTACLVWSSPLPGAARQPLVYLRLMEEKPHLLVGMRNNLGAETIVKYAPSTKFYLDDERDGHPWVTHLPFPVHVVERVETYDFISRSRFVSRYAYHHGYFDGPEREFRGFGMVEEFDTEKFAALSKSGDFPAGDNVEATSHVPPVLTRTWYHTGAFLAGERISLHFAHEYYGAPSPGDPDSAVSFPAFVETLLPDTILPPELEGEETQEACRALKGAMLRQEVYAQDGTDREMHPYTVAEQNFTIRLLQPRAGNQHAVFFTHPREALTYHTERNPADARIAHALTLVVDDFGNVLRSLAVGYPRASVPGRQPEQNETHMTLSVNRFANHDDQPDWRRIGSPVETRTYEVVKPPSAASRFSWQALNDLVTVLFPLNQDDPPAASTIPYEQWDWRKSWDPQTEPGGSANGAALHTRLRLIEQARTLYRNNLLSNLLPLGQIESLALPGESYRLAFTPELLAQVYKRPLDTIRPPGVPQTEVLLPQPSDILKGQGADKGGYVRRQDLDGTGLFPATDPVDQWWIPTGRLFYSPQTADAPHELAYARTHFFLAQRYRDPFGSEVAVSYDSDDGNPARNHNLLVVETKDPLGNIVTVRTADEGNHVEIRNNYRVLQPYWVTDPNRNRTWIAFDALGLVVGTAVMGKVSPKNGDDLLNFETDLVQSRIDDFYMALDPHALAGALLNNATTRIIYDLERFARSQRKYPTDPAQWQPPCAAALARETHVKNPQNNLHSKIQISFSYSDGFGREIQKKAQAEPGKVEVEDSAGNLMEVDTTPNLRWVGSGWTIFDNKGQPVRQYEPFFSTNHQFQFGKKVGVSPILFYDPVGRAVATLHPNHTWEKVVFDPWQQATYDVNDTVLNTNGSTDPRQDGDVGDFFSRLPDEDYLPTWYEQRSALDSANPERDAADKAVVHRQTPSIAHFDALGRPFLTIAHNRFRRDTLISEEQYATRVVMDIEGNPREVVDAGARIVAKYNYDLLGSRIHQASMEAGERWVLNDVTGKPVRAWDSRGFTRRMTYDKLRRPIELYVTENGTERKAERIVYGENQGDANNERTRVYQVFDGAGRVTNESYDFKGNLTFVKRDLLPDYRNPVNWLQNPVPVDGEFVTRTDYDALNRPTAVTLPENSVYRPTFNEANLLNKVELAHHSAGNATPFVTNIDYNAKGQRVLIHYDNGAETTYDYDPQTFRLVHLKTVRPTGLNGLATQLFANPAIVQDLHYTYDPAGNITAVTDGAIPEIAFNGEAVKPHANYLYDAIYRLISAHGREHIGQTAFNFTPPDSNFRDYPFAGLQASPNDPRAVRNYTETYDYDEVGNFRTMEHSATDGHWTRTYFYEEASLIESVAVKSNRLTRTVTGSGTSFPETYTYTDAQGKDVNGCMTAINSMAMTWDFKDQLQMVNLGGGGKAYYVYDSTGQRVRKVIINQNDQRVKERIYVGGYEIDRKFNGATGAKELERQTLHVMDNQQRIALVETKTIDINVPANELNKPLSRYQLGNHLGSSVVELDARAEVITYEEYHPYGTSSLQAARSQAEAPKRYRYTGKERDEESGFYYHGARYYEPWLGRWCSPEPLSLSSGTNLYVYVENNPVHKVDLDGRLGTIALGLIGAGVGFVGGVAYGLYKGESIETTLKYGVTGAVILGAAGLTLGASIYATGSVSAGVAAWGTKAIIGAGLNSSRQAIEKNAGKRNDFSITEMAASGVLAAAPIPAKIAAPVSGLSGSIMMIQGAKEIGNSGGNRYEKALGVVDATIGMLSYVAPLASIGSGSGPMIPALATNTSVVRSLATSTEANNSGSLGSVLPIDILMSNSEGKANPNPETKEEHRAMLNEQFEKGGWKDKMTILPPKGEMHEHHLLPQEFRQIFWERFKLNIENFKIWLEGAVHLNHFHGGAKNGGLWNETWKAWLLDPKNAKATQTDVLNQLKAMELQWDVENHSMGKAAP